ncbi:MAG: hypothetical protein ABW252_08210 [Polyangiales bacterium]
MLSRRIPAQLRASIPHRAAVCTLLFLLVAHGDAAHAQASPAASQALTLHPPPPPPPRTSAAPVLAQAATTPSTPAAASAAPASEPAASAGPTVERAREECVPKRDVKMNDYAFGVQLGIGHIASGDVANPTYTPALQDLANQLTEAQMEQAGLKGTGCSPLDQRCNTGARTGVQLSIPIQLGGAGVGFRVEPMFNFGKSAKSYGLYLGPTFNYRVTQPLYLGFGLGLKAAWVDADGWKYGGDFQGRIPVTGTLYVTDDVALVLEFAYGGGVSVFANDPRTVRNPLTGAVIDSKTPEATFGLGRAWDLTIGVRFP